MMSVLGLLADALIIAAWVVLAGLGLWLMARRLSSHGPTTTAREFDRLREGQRKQDFMAGQPIFLRKDYQPAFCINCGSSDEFIYDRRERVFECQHCEASVSEDECERHHALMEEARREREVE